jgi:hypothetical protein
MPEIVRDDAIYCSTSCKLKAQRMRKKEQTAAQNRQAETDVKDAAVADLVTVELSALDRGAPQLWFSFVHLTVEDTPTPTSQAQQLSFAFVELRESTRPTCAEPVAGDNAVQTTAMPTAESVVPTETARSAVVAKPKPRSVWQKLKDSLRAKPDDHVNSASDSGVATSRRSKTYSVDIV